MINGLSSQLSNQNLEGLTKLVAMAIQISYETAGVNWAEVAQVMELAPLAKRDPEQLRRAAENSEVVVFAHDLAQQERVVGFGRALSDGELCGVIYDVVVLPDYQGRGVGRAIVTALLARLPVHSIILYAVPGKEGFYEALGFHRLKTGMGKFTEPNILREKGYID